MEELITCGGDPEYWIVDDNGPIPAHEFLPGTKEQPHKLPSGAVQVDGMAVEVNIDPASTAEEFEHNVHAVLGEVRKLVPPAYRFSYEPSVEFLGSTIARVPEVHKELGCSPDWNAYSGLQNISPMLELQKIPNVRSAGGHIAIGWGKDLDKTSQSHIWDCEIYIKTIDELYCTFKDMWDKDTIRSRLYGKPGAYRPTSFGVEYRTPSNAWLKYPRLYPFMFQLAYATFEGMLGDGTYKVPKIDSSMLETVRSD